VKTETHRLAPKHLKPWLTAAVLTLLLLLGLTVYSPGLSGGFLFDDFPNLSKMGQYGEVRGWNEFRSFVFGGFAGPLGRPVSLASFLLDDWAWPSAAYGFKRTNLLIHLLTALALCWATLNLLRLYGVEERKAAWMAVLNMGIWLLHPYLVSTTLYVVQRMAQLAALFMFAGLAGYLNGRRLLPARPLWAYVWMTASLVLGTALAALSKENGVLLPILVLVVECCLPKGQKKASPDWRWRAVFVWPPVLAVFYQLGREIRFSPDPWPTRPFTQVERLWSEARILWEYLWHLFVPRIEGRGLFHDGYAISQGWLQPGTTLLGAIGIAVLLVGAVWLRRRLPLVSLAILFYFASHLLESTVVGLELYFEHRNYVASAFLFLPVVAAIVWLAGKISLSVVVMLTAAILGVLGWMTWQRSMLWGDNGKLQTYWALTTPDSPRAQNYLAVQAFRQGQPAAGMARLEEAMERLPHSSLLTMQWLLQRVLHGVATESDFKTVSARVVGQRFDAQAVLGLRMIVEDLIQPNKSPQYRQWTRELLQSMEGNSRYQKVPLFRRMKPYLEGLLWVSDGNMEKAMPLLALAMNRYADTDTSLSIVAHLGNTGHPVEALQLLDQTQSIYERQPVSKLKRPKAVYDAEIPRLRLLLEEDARVMQNAAISSRPDPVPHVP